jgi:hypothetical protein
MTTTRTYGVELEVVGITAAQAVEAIRAAGLECHFRGYTHAVTDYWKVVTDSSLTGSINCEVVSPKLAGEEGFRQITLVCNALEAIGAKVDKSTGMHVHVDVADLDFNQMRRVVKTFVKYEDSFDALIAPSRRNAYFARSNIGSLLGYYTTPAGCPGWNRYGAPYHAEHNGATREQMCELAFTVLDGCRNLDALRQLFINAAGSGEARYHKLNIEAYWRHRTFEYRCHQGTTNAAKVVAWVKLCVQMIDVAANAKAVEKRNTRNTGNDGIARLPGLFKAVKLDKETQKFFRQRAKELARETVAA